MTKILVAKKLSLNFINKTEIDRYSLSNPIVGLMNFNERYFLVNLYFCICLPLWLGDGQSLTTISKYN